MRHRKNKVTLDRTARQRRTLLRNMSVSLVMNGKIVTTDAKARPVRTIVERLVTVAKVGTLHSRRRIITVLANATAANKLLTEYGPKYKTRVGGYTRLTRLTPRLGDNAKQVLIEFV